MCDGVGSGRMASRPDWMVCEQVAKTRWFVLSDRLQSVLDDLEMEDEVSIELSLMQLQPTARLPAQAYHFQSLTEIFPTRWSLSVKRDSPGFAAPIPKGFKLKVGNERAEEMRDIVNEYLGAQKQRESNVSDERGYRKHTARGWAGRWNQVVQLTRAKPWLMQTPQLHQFQNPLALRLFQCPTMLPLVVCLSADSHVTASPRHAQPCDGLLREDLPAGFFTTRTP